MKTLYIVRHAKSSWDNPDISDFERPLNDRGKRDAPRMAKRLKEKDFRPDLVISSPAKRAYSTAKRICEILEYAKTNIKTDRRLYHAEEHTMLSVLRETKNKFNTVMMVGHNPGLTDFVNALFMDDDYIDIANVPTCGSVAFTFDTDDWASVDFGKGKFLFYDYPKSRQD
jgi:phosphohistidine phosphatase